jgi:ATP-binding cassette subfamily A (ABC1) protein 3
VVAVENLSLSVPKGEIFCLLGRLVLSFLAGLLLITRNGAAKSTSLGVIGQLVSSSGGLVEYRGGNRPRLGIAPQKNVLWDELTCQQVGPITP